MTQEFVPASELNSSGRSIMSPHLESVPKSVYWGCDPADHEFETEFGRWYTCTKCGYSLQSLNNWWGQDISLGDIR